MNGLDLASSLSPYCLRSGEPPAILPKSCLTYSPRWAADGRSVVPFDHQPTTLECELLEARRGIHRRWVSNPVEHGRVGDAVTVSVAVRQFDAISIRDLGDDTSLRITRNEFARLLTRPTAEVCFDFGRMDFDGRRKRARCDSRQRRKSSADQIDAMRARGVPFEAPQTLREPGQRRAFERTCPILRKAQRHSVEIRFVRFRRNAKIEAGSAKELREPAKSLHWAKHTAPQQEKRESALE
jgi:hypothetical protein